MRLTGNMRTADAGLSEDLVAWRLRDGEDASDAASNGFYVSTLIASRTMFSVQHSPRPFLVSRCVRRALLSLPDPHLLGVTHGFRPHRPSPLSS